MAKKTKEFVKRKHDTGVSRREFMGTTAKAVAAGSMAASFPFIAKAADPLRTIGLGVSVINEIQGQAAADLGYGVTGQALGYGAYFGKALNQNDQYDVCEGYFNDFDVFLPAKIFQPLDTQRISEWDKVSSLSKTGKLTPDSKEGDGDAPFRLLWCDADGNLIDGPSRYITALPMFHNADSLGYDKDALGRDVTSWAEMLGSDVQGRVGLTNTPQVGVMDVAMATEAAGLMSFGDKGDMTRAEIDQLMNYLIERKKEGHFRSFWETFGQSVNLMVSGEVLIESMWSPAVTASRAEGINCVYATLKEGYRGWHAGLTISAKVGGAALDRAYEYLNWWLNGWAGAFQGRMGYYHPIPDNVKKYLSAAEWDYWYMGKPAAEALSDPWGNPLVEVGEVRDGGSYETRFSNIAVWNSIMKENDYLVKRWTEFLSA